MKIMQKEGEFRPIAIILETDNEANVFWDAILKMNSDRHTAEEIALLIKISNFFSNTARF